MKKTAFLTLDKAMEITAWRFSRSWGRFMLAPYGHLVSTVLHQKHIYREYVGLDACAADLMRPAMYGAYHHITVLGKEDAILDHVYDVIGAVCPKSPQCPPR